MERRLKKDRKKADTAEQRQKRGERTRKESKGGENYF